MAIEALAGRTGWALVSFSSPQWPKGTARSVNNIYYEIYIMKRNKFIA